MSGRRAAAAAAAAADGARARRAIAASRASFAVSLEQGDARSASVVYAADAKLLPPAAETMSGREAIEAFWRAGLESGIREVVQEPLELQQKGSLAYEIGRYSLRLESGGGEPVVDHGRYLLVYERQDDGSWRRSAEMFHPDFSPGPTGQAAR